MKLTKALVTLLALLRFNLVAPRHKQNLKRSSRRYSSFRLSTWLFIRREKPDRGPLLTRNMCTRSIILPLPNMRKPAAL